MARPPLEPGEAGEISISEAPGGKVRARCRFRATTGDVHQVEASGKSAAEARRRLKARLKNWTAPTQDKRFRDFAAEWVQGLRDREEIRPQSADLYERTIRTTINPEIGGRTIAGITAPMLEELADKAFERSPNICNKAISILRMIFEEAMRRGLIEHSPAASLKRRKAKTKEVRALTIDELGELRGLIREWQAGPRRRIPLLDLVDLALSTGARLGELLAAKWENYDADTGTLSIESTMVYIKGKGIVDQGTTKEDTRLRLPLTSFAIAILNERRAADPDGTYIFATYKGTPYTHPAISRVLGEARGETYKWVTFHTFRKTVATLANEAQGSEVASQLLGHTSDKITRKHYIAADYTAVPDLTAVLEALAGDKAVEPVVSFDDTDEDDNDT